MPCKACHKPKTLVPVQKFVQGKRYRYFGAEYICARVDFAHDGNYTGLFALISLSDGNRYANPVTNINEVCGGSTFYEVK